MVNNPRSDRPALSYRRLGIVAALVGPAALISAPVGALVWPRFAPDLAGLVPDPTSFIAVWGAHMGVYLGAAAAVLVGAVWVARRRARGVYASGDSTVQDESMIGAAEAS